MKKEKAPKSFTADSGLSPHFYDSYPFDRILIVKKRLA
jgi:hypothetical protein